MTGNSHKLWELLSDFLFTARDVAAMACDVGPLALPPTLGTLPPEPVADEAAKAAFLERYGQEVVEPVFGHYLYRLAAPQAEPLPIALPQHALLAPPASASAPALGEKRPESGSPGPVGTRGDKRQRIAQVANPKEQLLVSSGLANGIAFSFIQLYCHDVCSNGCIFRFGIINESSSGDRVRGWLRALPMVHHALLSTVISAIEGCYRSQPSSFWKQLFCYTGMWWCRWHLQCHQSTMLGTEMCWYSR